MPTNPFEAGAPVASVHSFAHADKMIEDALADVHPQAHPEHARASHTEEQDPGVPINKSRTTVEGLETNSIMMVPCRPPSWPSAPRSSTS
jgi:hypothetical protein